MTFFSIFLNLTSWYCHATTTNSRAGPPTPCAQRALTSFYMSGNLTLLCPSTAHANSVTLTCTSASSLPVMYALIARHAPRHDQQNITDDDPLSCIHQLPPVFRKWFAHHILDTNDGEALQSALTFITGIFQQPPRLPVTDRYFWWAPT
jgi:hypothetical protein